MSNLFSSNRFTRLRVSGFAFGILLMIVSMIGIWTKGLNLGLDFTGGYLTEYSTSTAYKQSDMQDTLRKVLPDEFQLTMADGGHHWVVRQADSMGQTSSDDTNMSWLELLASELAGDVIPLDAVYMGSQVGDELIEQGGLALLTALIMILAYVAVRFEWRLALGAVLALFHDVIIVLGVFAWLQVSFDLTVLAAVLAIIGYSLNDSIIVADKLREHMKAKQNKTLDALINSAISATMVRTLITSGTTLTTVAAIGFFAGETLFGFALALFVGIAVGTYSSIAISSTLPQLLKMDVDHYHKIDEEQCTLP
ncbi:protein translocase subunit SecF [Thalassotalea fusca]